MELKKKFTLLFFGAHLAISTFGQNKILIGIMPFKTTNNNNVYGYYNGTNTPSESIIAIEDAVANAFLNTKRFTLVERQKIDQILLEKKLQKNEDFIDGKIVAQTSSLGAQYVVIGNVSEAGVERTDINAGVPFVPFVPLIGGINISSTNAKINFSLKIVDVATGEIIASNSFSAAKKGKNGFENALNIIKPKIEEFINENFKLSATIVEISQKSNVGDAEQVLISLGSSQGIKEKTIFKVFETLQIEVDNKKLTRKKIVGKIAIYKVEDDNFSLCNVIEGGSEISKKIEAGVQLKCEIINDKIK